MKNIQGSIVIGIMCFLLSLGIAIQISSMKNEKTVVAKENTENQLRDEVLEMTNEYDKSYNELDKLQEKLESLRNEVAESNEMSKDWSESLLQINNCLGLSNVKGKGIILQIKSGDILQVINALNNAGAEAIEINENRITLYSKILNDGDQVTLDGNVLESPYNIKAIGGDALYGAITMPGSYIDSLKKNVGYDYEVNISKSDSVEIKKYEGIYNFNFAKLLE